MVILTKIGIFDLYRLNRTPCRFFLGFFMKSCSWKPNFIAILSVFQYLEDVIRPELSSPARFRILGGYPERDERTEEIVSNIGLLVLVEPSSKPCHVVSLVSIVQCKRWSVRLANVQLMSVGLMLLGTVTTSPSSVHALSWNEICCNCTVLPYTNLPCMQDIHYPVYKPSEQLGRSCSRNNRGLWSYT